MLCLWKLILVMEITGMRLIENIFNLFARIKLIETNNNETEYDYIKYIKDYGELKNDVYYCKYCQEYLSPDIDQSNVEFDENDKPIYNQKIEIEEDEVKIEDIDLNKIAGLIGTISKLLGTELTNTDIVEIIELYNKLDHKSFMISRYNNDTNILKSYKLIMMILTNLFQQPNVLPHHTLKRNSDTS